MFYFDHNSTTPLASEVLDAYVKALQEVAGNASSMHRAGQAARQRLESARREIASALRAAPAEIVFTSGGTESNNLAVWGLMRGLPVARKHVVTSVIEHPAVLEPLRELESSGARVTRVRVNSDGVVDAQELARELCPETVLVSVMHANNESGALQPIAEIGASVSARRAAGQAIYFHSDGVQALGKIRCDLMDLAVDLYSMSAHKIYGPKGVGALFVRSGTPLGGIQFGGRHERDRRAGTENVPGAVAFARALELSAVADASEMEMLRNRFEARVGALEGVEVNSGRVARLPHTSNILFRGVSGEALLIALDTAGMAVSTGSACASGSIEPSHVLLAMGRTVAEARSSVRFSFGRYNTVEEVDRLGETVVGAVKRLRTGKTRRAELAVR